MKNSILYSAILTILLACFVSAQNLNELFQKPLESNPEPWLKRQKLFIEQEKSSTINTESHQHANTAREPVIWGEPELSKLSY